MRMKSDISWKDIYQEWETYAGHFELIPPASKQYSCSKKTSQLHIVEEAAVGEGIYVKKWHEQMPLNNRFQVPPGNWLSSGSQLTFDLIESFQTDPEKLAAIWIASFCRDLLQDYAYLLNSKAYMLINHIYFQSIKQFQAESVIWSKPLTRLQPKLFISYRLLEHTDLTKMPCILELAMLQASLTQSYLL